MLPPGFVWPWAGRGTWGAGRPPGRRLQDPRECENGLRVVGPVARLQDPEGPPGRRCPLPAGRRAGWGSWPVLLLELPCREAVPTSRSHPGALPAPTVHGVPLRGHQLSQRPECILLGQEHQQDPHNLAHALAVAHLLREPTPMERGHLNVVEVRVTGTSLPAQVLIPSSVPSGSIPKF